MNLQHAATSGFGRSVTIGSALLLLVSGTLGCASVRPVPRSGVQRSGFERSHEARLDGWNPAGRRREGQAIYLVLKVGERRLYVVPTDADGGALGYLKSFPVAVGRRDYETPIGRFRVKDMTMNPRFTKFDSKNPSKVIGAIPPGPDNPLGARWIGFTSGHGGEIGFHGTPNPELLGQAVSHGCVRMRNSDVVVLYELVRVGTAVIVQP